MAAADTAEGWLSDFWQSGSKTAASAAQQASNAYSSGMNLFAGLQQGGAKGDITAATSAAKLGVQTGVLPQAAGSIAGDLTNLTNIITGIQQGGVAGYGSAGINTAALAGNLLQQGAKAGYLSSSTGAIGGEIGSVAAPLASALSVYNFAKGWQSGQTGADAIRGAQMGATIGTEILPGVGTVLGGLAGAAFGAVSSAFGGGTVSQEGQMSRSVNSSLANATESQRASAISSMTPAQATQYIQGVMSAHDQSPGHAEPIQLVWGKDNSSGFIRDMTSYINSQIGKNPNISSMSPQQIYSQVVSPWLQSKGASIDPNQKGYGGSDEGQNLIDAVTNIIGQWQSGSLTASTQVGVAGQTISGLQSYAGTPPTQQQGQVTAQQAYQPTQQASTSLGAILGMTGTW